MRATLFVIERMVMVAVFLLAIQTTMDHVTGASVQMFQSEGIPRASSAPVIEAAKTLENSVDFSKYPKHQVVATGYTAGYESTGKKPNSPAYGVTYSGVKPRASSAPVIEAAKTLENSVDFSKYPKHQVVATGYTAGYESTGKKPNSPAYGVTYSGVKVKRDLYSTIAADLTVFPVGTILFVPGYGYGVVADTGSAIKGNRLDLYYETVQDVYNQWGKKKVDVYIVEVGKGTLSENQLSHLNEAEDMQVFRAQILGKAPE